jgi:DNA-binding NtrC family response regulator
MDAAGRSVLVVDDDPAARRLLDIRLRGLDCSILSAGDGQEALDVIERESPALVLLDLQMPGMGGMELLRRLRRDGNDVPVIVITAHGSIETAVEAIKDGATDFLLKPVDAAHLDIVVRKALERRDLVESNRLLREALAARMPGIIGGSDVMRPAIEAARKAALTSSTVLLLGESGTGKEVFAHAIHAWSPRSEKPFVVVNCVALSEHLLESELFGHERGAFTGAHQAKKGKFELANGGTVFLDEIGDMPGDLQAKLLRVLQDHKFERVGGTRPIQADIRVIAATNRNLDEAVRKGRFREDLFYRLNVIRIVLPPLRKRIDDLTDLVRHFVARYAAETKRPVPSVSPDAMALLREHAWPGNVRELANTIERAVVLCGGEQIRPKDLALPVIVPQGEAGRGGFPTGGISNFHDLLKEYKRAVIQDALRKCGGNQTQAAKRLGLQRTYLSKLVRDLGITASASAEDEAD